MRNAKSSIRVKRPKCSEVRAGVITNVLKSVKNIGCLHQLLKGQIPVALIAADVRQGVIPVVTVALETFSSKYSRDL